MTGVRQAGPADAPELVRLRRLMLSELHGRDEAGRWEQDAERTIRHRLRDQSGGAGLLGAFVVDGEEPGPPHLAACAVGTVEERLPAPRHPHGRFGFVFNVCTDERYRRRGYARATTEALLEWFARQRVTRVDLHTSGEAERMYRSMGFSPHSVALSLDLSQRD